MVANPLEILGHEKNVRARSNQRRIIGHAEQHFADQAVIMLVDLIIIAPDPDRRFDIEG